MTAPSIGKECSACGRYYREPVREGEILCPHCGKERVTVSSSEWTFSRCPHCRTRKFYRRKDFNQVLGCLIVLLGAVLVPFTYGVSLPVLILADWILYRRVPDVVVCYRCGAEFRGFRSVPETIGKFDHHTAELYETETRSVS
ncbi:MAG: hypothetical protein ACE5LH_00090 [Fidelibacterota bacterium]